MKGVLKIATADVYLGQKLYRELAPLFQHIEISRDATGDADVWLIDTRTQENVADAPNIFYLADTPDAYASERTLPLPLPLGRAAAMLGQTKAPILVLSDDTRSIRLYGSKIKLTEVEYALLHALVKAEGAFISREELRRRVWGEESSEGLLNVYIHYLREKLERGGEKVILSSRKSGYAIADKFTGRTEEC